MRGIEQKSLDLSGVGAVVFEATPMMLLAKTAGAIAGSLISIAYVLPRGRREAMLRLTVGLVSGFAFGGTVGIKIADMLGVLGRVSALEVTLMGAAFASLCAWWALGVLQRLAERAQKTDVSAELLKSIKAADEKKERRS